MQQQPRAAPAAQTRQASSGNRQQQKPPELTPQALLDRILEEQSSPQMRLVQQTLDAALDQVEDLLPEKLKGCGPRLIKRAKFYFSHSEVLKGCTAESLVRTFIAAAEAGLPLDGRLAHAVPFWNKDLRANEAQFIADYKGLIAVARRNGRIKDAYARLVFKGDIFRCGTKDDRDQLYHQEAPDRRTGEVVGAYVKILFPDGSWRYDHMDRQELDAIEEKVRVRCKDGVLKGPWKTDKGEMQKKTVCKRGLKTYVDDEDLERLHRLEERAETAPAGWEAPSVQEPHPEPEEALPPPPRGRMPTGSRPTATDQENGGSGPSEATPPAEAAAEPAEPAEYYPSEAFAALDVAIDGTGDEDSCRPIFNQVEAAGKAGSLREGEKEELVRRWSAKMNGFRKAALAASKS